MWEYSAPSNIALIKYMGKTADAKNPAAKNVASNPSLSWTLDHLRSFVQLEETTGADRWEGHPGFPKLSLSEKGKAKFLNHLQFLKKQFNLTDKYFVVRSGNNFPADCGIASSASSFAALTDCAAQAFAALTGQPKPSADQKAAWSRQGSGSSCRSFFEGWVAWDEKGVRQIPSPLGDLWHQVFIVDSEKKLISSSEAHENVQSSLLMKGRPERALARFELFENELKGTASWPKLFELSWADFWDMHALFETSVPPFGYMREESLQLLASVRSLWETSGDGPVATMDAGANVHLLWREDQEVAALEFAEDHPRFQCLSNMDEGIESVFN